LDTQQLGDKLIITIIIKVKIPLYILKKHNSLNTFREFLILIKSCKISLK